MLMLWKRSPRFCLSQKQGKRAKTKSDNHACKDKSSRTLLQSEASTRQTSNPSRPDASTSRKRQESCSPSSPTKLLQPGDGELTFGTSDLHRLLLAHLLGTRRRNEEPRSLLSGSCCSHRCSLCNGSKQ